MFDVDKINFLFILSILEKKINYIIFFLKKWIKTFPKNYVFYIPWICSESFFILNIFSDVCLSVRLSGGPYVCLSVYPSVRMPVCLSVCPSVSQSVYLKLKISVTTELIGLYSSRNISTGPVMVLGYFLGGWDTPNPLKNYKYPPPKKKKIFTFKN